MNNQAKKNIVILGAGFAGLHAARELAKDLNDESYQIILVDKSTAHLYTPDLYEIAAAFNEEITQECLTALKETVATPIKSLIDESKVHFMRDKILEIKPESKEVILRNHGALPYKYLVVTMGSRPNFFNIPGLEEHSYPVKTIKNALAINCEVDMHVHKRWEAKDFSDFNIIVGGGGATGVEIAAEFAQCLDKLSKKYDFPRVKMHIKLVEASEKLAGLSTKGTNVILKRFKSKNVETYLGFKIIKVDEDKLTIENDNSDKQNLPYDFLIWTGGVMVHPIVQKSLGDPEKRGAIPVNMYLQSIKYDDVFAAGDNAYFEDPKTGERAAMLAQIAFRQGKIMGANIARLIKKEPRIAYKIMKPLYVIPLGGKNAIFAVRNFIFSGFFCWLLHQLVTFKYSLSIMPFSRALKKSWHNSKIFLRND